MHKIQHSLRLVRAGNLLIIALSMILIKFVVFEAWLMNMLVEEHAVDAGTSFTEAFVLSPHYQINFVLLVISTVSIGAAGNIINDYFDIKADRVNRPDTIVIGKHIKRRRQSQMWCNQLVGNFSRLLASKDRQNFTPLFFFSRL